MYVSALFMVLCHVVVLVSQRCFGICRLLISSFILFSTYSMCSVCFLKAELIGISEIFHSY